MDLTVAICTYRRPEMLRETLASLAACDPIDARWELLLIDNEGSSKVREIAESFADRLPLRYLHESELGASHARNRAVREADAPIILFTDDDVTFEQNWLQKAWRAIREQPQCAFWGGRVEPHWQSDPPAWFATEHCSQLGDTIVQYRRGEEPRPWDAEKDPPFYTANLAFRVAAIQRAGYFDTTVGHRGNKRMGMEDSLMVKAIAKAGGKGWYAADAVVHHPVPEDRATKQYARRFAWRQGWLGVEMYGGPRSVPLWYYRTAMGGVCSCLVRWIKGMVSREPGRAFAGQFELIFHLSKLWHALFGRRREM